jgi:hypothetical protein
MKALTFNTYLNKLMFLACLNKTQASKFKEVGENVLTYNPTKVTKETNSHVLDSKERFNFSIS